MDHGSGDLSLARPLRRRLASGSERNSATARSPMRPTWRHRSLASMPQTSVQSEARSEIPPVPPTIRSASGRRPAADGFLGSRLPIRSPAVLLVCDGQIRNVSDAWPRSPNATSAKSLHAYGPLPCEASLGRPERRTGRAREPVQPASGRPEDGLGYRRDAAQEKPGPNRRRVRRPSMRLAPGSCPRSCSLHYDGVGAVAAWCRAKWRPGMYRGQNRRRAASPATGRERHGLWTPTGAASSGSARLWTGHSASGPPAPAGISASTCSPSGRSDTSSATDPPWGVLLIQSVRPPASRGHSRQSSHRGVQTPSPLVTATTRPWPDLWNAINGSPRTVCTATVALGCGRVTE